MRCSRVRLFAKRSFGIWLPSSEAGYISKIVSAFISAAPSQMYAYLAAHSESVLSSLAKNLMHFGTCDIVRFLLDVPLENEKPWWGESASFVDPFLD